MIPGGIGERHPGAVRPAKVLRYYLDPDLGIPVADVVDSYGAFFSGCRVICPGGGDAENFELIPPPVDDPTIDIEVTGEVLLVLGDGVRAHPYVMGTCYVAGLATQVTTDTADTGDGVEYHDKNHVYDRVIRHRGCRMVFSYSGTWLVDLTSTKKPARFQLDKDSFLRISQDDEAEEYVLLGTKALEHLRSIHERLDALADKIDAVEAHAAAIGASWGTAAGILAGTAPVSSTGSPIVVATYVDAPVSTAVDVWDFSKTATIASATDGGSDNLIAGCFRVSKVALADQE